MKTTYKSLPAIAPQNITLLLGKNPGMNIDASLSHSIELVGTEIGGAVLYLNTVQTPRSMYESARNHGLRPDGNGYCTVKGSTRKVIYMMNIERGNLHKSREMIDYYLSEGRIQYVVVNSWEFAAKGSRYREEAIFLLKELISGMNADCHYEPVSVIVYAQEPPVKPEAQTIQRGGFGRLTGLVKKAESITIEEQFETEEVIENRTEMIKHFEQEADPRIGTEEEEGISDEEYMMRFLARVKPQAEKEWKESGKPMKTVWEVASEKSEESSIVDSGLSIVGEEVTSDISETSMDELRNIPAEIGRMPIHLNSYSPDKSPITKPLAPNTRSLIPERVHNDMIKK